jgi:hypothetical protein
MKKRLLFLTMSILVLLSCEKNESGDFLTNGTWILDSGLNSTTKETLKFDSNGKYLAVSELVLPKQILSVRGNISGDYIRQANQIHFTSTMVDLPDFTSTSGIQFENVFGQPIGSFYGYSFNGWPIDSLLLDSDSTRYSELIDRVIFQTENSARTWMILTLTNDSLKVQSNNIITKYYKK